MLSFASAAYTADKKLVDTFSTNLDTLPNAEAHPDTKIWWDKNPEAWNACRQDCQSPEKAMKDYAKIVELTQDTGRGYYIRGALYLEENKLDRCIQECSQAIKIQPQPEAYSVRGDAFMKQGDVEHALRDFERAKRIDEIVAKAYLMRSKSYKEQGEHKKAAQDYVRAVAIDPSLGPGKLDKEKTAGKPVIRPIQ